MGTYYLSLSMAGTVSAGTYTGGVLVELDLWLKAFQKAKKNGVQLKAVKKVGNYNPGDVIALSPSEIPNHSVKIQSMTGASGGGVSAALYLVGLTTGKVEELLRDVWTGFDIDDMLSTNDLHDGARQPHLKTKKFFSIFCI